MTKLKLEVGKYYRTRDGLKVGPMNGISFKWVDDLLTDDCRWEWSNNGDGNFGAPDIIAEWTDTPTIGTLAEIGAQVGDVVAYVDTCSRYTVRDDMHLENIEGDLIEYSSGWGVNGGVFRVVSRASDAKSPVELSVDLGESIKQVVAESQSGPVQLRKVIVPGVYGKVRVETDGPHIKTYIEISDYMSRDDLTAAIETLTAIRDAL